MPAALIVLVIFTIGIFVQLKTCKRFPFYLKYDMPYVKYGM